MTQQMNIETRLQNWSRWCRQTRERPSDANSITGFICDRMRKAALGNVWSGHDVADPIDEADAEFVERRVIKLIPMQHLLLKHHYVARDRWQIGCRIARVRISKDLYDQALGEARRALEASVNREGQ